MSNVTVVERNKLDIAREILAKMIDRRLLAALEVCVRCGICTESCHYYQSEPRKEHAPYYRAEQLRRLYRSLFDPVGRLIPSWVGARAPSEEMLPKIGEIAFSTCTMCQRCTLASPSSLVLA